MRAALWRTLWKWCPRALDDHYSARRCCWSNPLSAPPSVSATQCDVVATPNWSTLVDTTTVHWKEDETQRELGIPTVLSIGLSGIATSIFHVWHGRNSIVRFLPENRTLAAQIMRQRNGLTCATPISYTISHKNAKFMQLLQMPSHSANPTPHGVPRSETRGIRPDPRESIRTPTEWGGHCTDLQCAHLSSVHWEKLLFITIRLLINVRKIVSYEIDELKC